MNVLNEMVMVRLTIFFVILYGSCCVDCAINISPAGHHHANNIISKDDINKNATVPEITLDGPPQIVIIQAEPTQNTRNEKNESAETKTPMMISIPFGHNKKVLTSIVHPLPRTMHDMMPREPSRPTHLDLKKTHEDFLKHEVPKLQKRLHHHYTVEELRQKRKELKEKWQARHNKLSHLTPHGLHDKIDQHLKAKAKHPETHKHSARKENLESDNPENLKINIADMYEQMTPRTRRILEHKEEESHTLKQESLSPHPSESKHPPPFNEYTESIQPEVLQVNGAKRSIPPEGSPKSYIEHTTESLFNVANINLYPILPDPQVAPVYFWPTATSEYTPSSSNTPAASSSSMKPTDSTLLNTSEKSTTEKSSTYWLDPIALLNRDEPFEFHSGARAVAGTLTTDVPAPSKDDVVSVKIDSAKEVFTIRTNNPPYYRNMTEQEAFLYQKPVFNYGKSAEEVGNSIDGMEREQLQAPIDTALSDKEKIPDRKPLFHSESSEEVGDFIDVHPGIENEQVTVPIDTPPFYRNLTYEEKILIQKPIFLGKSAEEVGDSIDVHSDVEKDRVVEPLDIPLRDKKVTYKKKKKIQKPFLHGKSSEEKGDAEEEIHIHKPIVLGESSEEFGASQRSTKDEKIISTPKSSQHVTSTPKNTSLEISEEPQDIQDWKEHLREAVKERLRKFRRDSAEIRLL